MENCALVAGQSNYPRGRQMADAIRPLIRNQFPDLATAAFTRQALREIGQIIRENIGLLSAGLSTAALAILLPSICVALINSIGFTTGGVVAGSLAAIIQSSVYGAYTTGLFSSLQAIGVTASIASPGIIVFGGILLVSGAGLAGYRLYRAWQDSRAHMLAEHLGEDDSDSDANESAPPRQCF